MFKKLKPFLPGILAVLCIAILTAIPTGYEDALIYQGTDRCTAEILSTDESGIISSGLIKSGEQRCRLKLLGGLFRGQEAEGVNMLNGSLENDKIFAVGDKAQVVVSHKDGRILSVTMIDHYRVAKEGILAGLFILFLMLFAGRKGIYAVCSFIITVMTIWKILVPCYLDGENPVIAGMGITVLLTVIIIFLVYGWDRRSVAAAAGALLGTATTCILGIVFTDMFQIHGAVMSYSETLLYSGYENLNLTAIFTSGIFIGASGAMMDLAVDITSAIHEVIQKKPEIGWREAAGSGMNVGRAAMGTMTTTLLLAYSGGYVALLMVFMAQGTPVYNILNYKYVASEILDTVVGSFGLVTVAPFTAIAGAFILTRKKKQPDAACIQQIEPCKNQEIQ